jgi:hypothetical protein
MTTGMQQSPPMSTSVENVIWTRCGLEAPFLTDSSKDFFGLLAAATDGQSAYQHAGGMPSITTDMLAISSALASTLHRSTYHFLKLHIKTVTGQIIEQFTRSKSVVRSVTRSL